MNPTTNTEAGAVADVAAIARGLTKAQLRALQGMSGEWSEQRRGGRGGFGCMTLDPLEDSGLTESEYRPKIADDRIRFARLTPLGLAVRQHLTALAQTRNEA